MAATRIEFVYPSHTSAPLGTYASSSYLATGTTVSITSLLIMVVGMLGLSVYVIFIATVFLNELIATIACSPYTGQLDGEEIFFPLVGL